MTDTSTEVVPADTGGGVTFPIEHVKEEIGGHEHPSARQYVVIAVVLCILTAFEVGLYYLEGDVHDNILIAMLAALAFAKFFLVCSWYMHMRMDAPFFRRTFITGILLACFVYGVVLFTFASTVLAV